MPIRKLSTGLFHLVWPAFVAAGVLLFVAMHRNLFGPGGENLHLLRGAWLSIAGLFGAGNEVYPVEEVWSQGNVLRPAVTLMWIAYAAMLFLLKTGLVGKTVRLRTLLLIALGAGIPLLLMPHLFSSDVFDYIIYGRLPVIYGDDPFTSSACEYPKDPFYNMTCWKAAPSAYGPAWTSIAVILVVISQIFGGGPPVTVFLFKSLALACHLGSGIMIWKMMTRAESPTRAFATALYLFNPLAFIESAGNGHNEALMIFAVLAALQLEQRGRWALASLAFTVAIHTKLYILPTFCLYLAYRWWREPDAKQAWMSVAGCAAVFFGASFLLYLPFGFDRNVILSPIGGPAARSLTKSLAEYMVFKSSVKLASFPIIGGYFVGNRQEDVRAACLFITALFCAGGAIYARTLTRAVTAMAYFGFIWAALGATWFMPWYVMVPVALSALSPSRTVRWSSMLLALLSFLVILLEGWSWGKSHNLMVAYYQLIVFLPPLALMIALKTADALMALWRIGTLRANQRGRNRIQPRPQFS